MNKKLNKKLNKKCEEIIKLKKYIELLEREKSGCKCKTLIRLIILIILIIISLLIIRLK